MALVLGEDQQILKQSAADFVKRESPVSRIRELRDGQNSDGFSRDLWQRMAELGWAGILVPEQYGGLGMGCLEMMCVLEECGRNLVPEPVFSTAVLGVNSILLGGTEEQKTSLLPSIVDGSVLATLAHQERGSRYNPAHVSVRAQRRGDSWVLNGEKILVPDGHSADVLVVSVRTSGDVEDENGIALFLVKPDTPGVEVVRQSTMHLRNAAIVRLTDAEVGGDALLGGEDCADTAGPVLADVIDRSTALLCAEMLGGMGTAFDMTLDYLKTRKQFGVLIGSFQALKHRAALMFVELELSRSVVLGACDAIDRGADNWREAVSTAKARCSDAGKLIGYEGIQLHGGIGMTDEHDIGFYAKRARGLEMTFGDAAYHRSRFADLQGY
jgi:alkylation response protein AidB-like acyl-CoA dehydrogenase